MMDKLIKKNSHCLHPIPIYFCKIYENIKYRHFLVIKKKKKNLKQRFHKDLVYVEITQ